MEGLALPGLLSEARALESSHGDDRYKAMGLALAAASTPDVQCVVHPEDPAVKSRARVVRGHAYTPARTLAAQASLAARLERLERFTGNVAVACVFRRSNRQRVDVDNLLKLVLDAGTQANLWDDDSQVTALVGVIELDPSAPRSTIAFATHQSSMARGPDSLTPCEACGTPFDPYGVPNRRFCSSACRMTLAELVPCPHCGEMFKRRTARSKYCSVECRGLAQRRSSPCAGCGRNKANRGATYCRDCFRAERRDVEDALLVVMADGEPQKLEALAALLAPITTSRVHGALRGLAGAGVVIRERKGWYRLAPSV